MVRRLLFLCSFAFLCTPAFAQSTYVAGALGADVSRVSHSDSDFYSSPSSGSEVLSAAIRVGTSITPVWGVELEFARSARSRDEGPIAVPLMQAMAANAIAIFPIPVDVRPEVRARHMSVDALAWARQGVGGKVDLVYLAGVALTRERTDFAQDFGNIRPAVARALTYRFTSIEYATRPVVGMEARVSMTDHLRLVPGIRVQGLADGWMLRPSVGLGWVF